MTQIASLSHSGVINGNEIDLYVIRAKRNWDKKINVIPEPRSKNHWNRGRKVTALDMLKIDILWEITAMIRDLPSNVTITDEAFKTGALNEWAPLPATGLSSVTIKHDTTTLVEGTDYEINASAGLLKIINSSYAEQNCTITYTYNKSAINIVNILARMLEKGGDITLKFNRGMGSDLESTHTVQMNKMSWTYESAVKNAISVTISLMELPHR